MSSGNRKLGPRLLVMVLAFGIVVLGAYPIRRHYGGAKGLYERAFPGGFQWGLPDVKAVRAYLQSLDEESRKRKSGEGATNVKTVKLTPETSGSSSGGFFAGLRNFFGGAEG